MTAPQCSITSLDPFIVSKVLECFSAQDVVNCSYICKKWNAIAQTSSLWYLLYLRDFGNYSSTTPPPSLDCVDWKKKYAFATSIYILRNFTLGDNNNKAQKMCWIGMMLTKQDKSYLSALSRYPLYNQSIYCWNVYIKRMGQIVCMSVVDMKPQPLYENPLAMIDGVCFTYSIHDRESFENLQTNINHKKETLKHKSIVIIALTSYYNSTAITVTSEEGRALARETKADYYEVDLRSYAGLDESFIYLLENIYKSKPLRECNVIDEVVKYKHKRKGKCTIC